MILETKLITYLSHLKINKIKIDLQLPRRGSRQNIAVVKCKTGVRLLHLEFWPSLTSCVTLGELLNLSLPPFLFYEVGIAYHLLLGCYEDDMRIFVSHLE